MEKLLKLMDERLAYLESEQSSLDGMDDIEKKWRIRELTLAIIATQQELLNLI